MEYYSATIRNDILKQATTGINLKNTMFSEKSQTQECTYHKTPFIRHFQNRQIHGDRTQIGEKLLTGYGGLCWSAGNRELKIGGGYTTLRMYSMPLTSIL